MAYLPWWQVVQYIYCHFPSLWPKLAASSLCQMRAKFHWQPLIPASAIPANWFTEKLLIYAIRNEISISRRVIKTIQQQNDIGVVRAPNGEQNSSFEKGRPTTVQSLNFEKLKSWLNPKPFFWIVHNELCRLQCSFWLQQIMNCKKTKHKDTGIWPQKLCFLGCIIISMVQNSVCTNFCLFLTQEYKVMRINEKVAQTLRC